MGEVINISSVSDLDIFSEFDAQCPAIPDDIDLAIQHSAAHAVGQQPAEQKAFSFRTVCAGIALASIVAVASVTLTEMTPESGNPATVRGLTGEAQPVWRQTRESWQAYIAQLEKDPAYLHLLRERALFQHQYP